MFGAQWFMILGLYAGLLICSLGGIPAFAVLIGTFIMCWGIITDARRQDAYADRLGRLDDGSAALKLAYAFTAYERWLFWISLGGAALLAYCLNFGDTLHGLAGMGLPPGLW